jgi:hypothetical protein
MATAFTHIVAGTSAEADDVNLPCSQLAAAVDAVDAKDANGISLATGHSFSGATIHDALEENYSAIAAGLTVGNGTESKSWTIYKDFAGSPVDTLTLAFERGTSTNAGIRFNETTDVLQGNEGSAWNRLVTTSNFLSLFASGTVVTSSNWGTHIVEANMWSALGALTMTRHINASDFQPCTISGSTTTNVDWAPTCDSTYWFPKVRVVSAQTSLNYYAFSLLYRLPEDFADFNSATAAILWIKTDTVQATQNHVDVNIRHKASALAAGTSCSSATKSDQKASASGTWTQLTWSKANLTGGGITWAAGDLMFSRVKVETKSSKAVEFGPLILQLERT